MGRLLAEDDEIDMLSLLNRKGAFDYITKPFRKEQILLALDKARRWQELTAQNHELRSKLAQPF